MNARLGKIRQERIKKLQEWRHLGVDPFPPRLPKRELIEKARGEKGKKVSVCGRIRAWRGHGGSSFADLYDQSGKIQLFFSRRDLGEENYHHLDLLDIGDFLFVRGEVFETKKGEISVKVSSYQLLAKSLRPLPGKWRGLKDIELRCRKRYLDLLINPASFDVFLKRSQTVSFVRSFLEKEGFLEVETPTLQPLYGGASARPFVTHHHALDVDLYLKVSDELYLKRLIIGGIEKVFEIDHNFRNEGIDKHHNPEFTMMECYWAYADYHDMMRLTEELFSRVAKEVLGETIISYHGHKINLKTPWERISMAEAIKHYLGWDPQKISDRELKKKLAQKKMILPGEFNRGQAMAALFEEVEPYLVQPTFIYDYPKETTMLCKLKPENPDLIERFEPYIAGMEVGNAYSELNDPLLQREFFADQVERKKAGDEEATPMDEDFLEAMEYGMPPTGGLGIGIDRMIMLLTGQENIRDVILFPTLRPKKE
ncbi:lysine--tRNA ligase [Candidatus Shapirobacteria bacterium]|nr:lysine--tRNA ligase [Candidatus Shapirobacteria bacterium]